MGYASLANFSEQFLLCDEEREILTQGILDHVRGRVPVIVTTTHFSSKVCADRSRRAQGLGAAMVMVMPPYHGATLRVPEENIFEFYSVVSDAISIPLMVQDAPVSGTTLSAPFLARMAREIEHVSYFKIETAGAAAKLRELIRLGGDSVEGPWDGEEAITLIPDLEAGATGAMTGGGFPDGVRPILEDYRAGRREQAIARYERWLPLINIENRQCGLLAAKALMRKKAASLLARRLATPSRCFIRRVARYCSKLHGGWTRWFYAGHNKCGFRNTHPGASAVHARIERPMVSAAPRLVAKLKID